MYPDHKNNVNAGVAALIAFWVIVFSIALAAVEVIIIAVFLIGQALGLWEI